MNPAKNSDAPSSRHPAIPRPPGQEALRASLPGPPAACPAPRPGGGARPGSRAASSAPPAGVTRGQAAAPPRPSSPPCPACSRREDRAAKGRTGQEVSGERAPQPRRPAALSKLRSNRSRPHLAPGLLSEHVGGPEGAQSPGLPASGDTADPVRDASYPSSLRRRTLLLGPGKGTPKLKTSTEQFNSGAGTRGGTCGSRSQSDLQPPRLPNKGRLRRASASVPARGGAPARPGTPDPTAPGSPRPEMLSGVPSLGVLQGCIPRHPLRVCTPPQAGLHS